MKKTHTSNNPEIETVYNLTDATGIIVDRASKATRKLLCGTFKEFTQSPTFSSDSILQEIQHKRTVMGISCDYVVWNISRI